MAKSSNYSPTGVFERATQTARNQAPMIASMIAFVVAGFIAFCIAVAAWTTVPEVSRAPGEITPKNEFRQIEAPEFGTVEIVGVREGDVVNAGDVLAMLRSVDLERELASVTEELASFAERTRNHAAILAALDAAEVGGDVLAGVAPDLEYARSALSLLAAKEKAELDLIDRLGANIASETAALTRLEGRRAEKTERLADVTDLFQRGLTTFTAVSDIEDEISRIDDQIHALGLGISSAQREVDLLRTKLLQGRWELRDENTQKSFDLRQSRLIKETEQRSLTDRMSALEIVASNDGVIHSVGFPNKGEVIDRGETLFELLPTGEALIAVLRLPTREVGHISKGMDVKLRLETFDARTTLPLDGWIASVSPNRVFDRDLGMDYFRATVALDEESAAFEMLGDQLGAGMVVTAEIVTRERSMLSYMLKPVERSLRMAFGER